MGEKNPSGPTPRSKWPKTELKDGIQQTIEEKPSTKSGELLAAGMPQERTNNVFGMSPCLARRRVLLGVHPGKAWMCPSVPAGPTRVPTLSRASSNFSFVRSDPESLCLPGKPWKSIPASCLAFGYGAQTLSTLLTL